jgi:hypothetical protein
LITQGDKDAMKPRSALAKSVVSSQGSACSPCADSMTAVGGLWSTGNTLPLTPLCRKGRVESRGVNPDETISVNLFYAARQTRHTALTALNADGRNDRAKENR